MKRLEGKVSIVTGGGSGIGRGISLRFAAEGSKVTVAEIISKNGKETVSMIKDAGGEAIFVETDVSRASDIEKMVKSTIEAFGAIHILCNNAGILSLEPPLISELTEEVWDRTMAVNLKGVYLCCKYVVPEMIKTGGGSIVNIASTAGLVKSPNFAYAASKGGVISFTRSLAMQCAPYSIRVNVLCPGATYTPGLQAAMRDVRNVNAQKIVPTSRLIPRLGTAEDIAQAALFLVSDESCCVTSAVWPIDGGSLKG